MDRQKIAQQMERVSIIPGQNIKFKTMSVVTN